MYFNTNLANTPYTGKLGAAEKVIAPTIQVRTEIPYGGIGAYVRLGSFLGLATLIEEVLSECEESLLPSRSPTRPFRKFTHDTNKLFRSAEESRFVPLPVGRQMNTPQKPSLAAQSQNDDTSDLAMKACVAHSRALLESARAVQMCSHPNIAYHLATLALEELGRRELIAVQRASAKQAIPPTWAWKHTESHIKKLFWCFFGASFFSVQLTKEMIQSMEDLARRIHETRMAGLYVDINEGGLHVPIEAVDAKKADEIISLAEARIDMCEVEDMRFDFSQEELDIQSWVIEKSEDPETRKMIFSSASLKKMTELKSGLKWGKWIKSLFEETEAANRELAEREIQRGIQLREKDTPVLAGKSKWRVRIRLYTQSHSIRPGVLSKWNKATEWIQLAPVSGKKDQLLVDIILSEGVAIQSLWHFAWGVARAFVTALNIGTMGFWWWRMSDHISRYYEYIEDLEVKEKVVLERSPSLRVDWGKNRVLTENDLAIVSSCFAAILRARRGVNEAPYNHYIGGVTFLALNDVHWQCEDTVFGNFFLSIKEMMKETGDWKESESLTESLLNFLLDMFPAFDERDVYQQLFEAFENGNVEQTKVTLKEASFMKLFCDAYFLQKIRPSVRVASPAAQTNS